jgi:phosphatidylserine/phosphatidylglycerophosphate/cardiolipin synthase-like enzyme
VKVEEIWNDRFDRTRYPRMPWHDVHSCVMGPPVVDLCRHFIQRWNFTRITQDKQNKPVMLPYQAVAMREAQAAETKRDLEKGDLSSAARAGQEGPTAPPSAFSASINPKHPCECDEGDNHGASNYCQHDWTQHWSKSDVQVLRSVGEWSAGTETECSIFRAYVHAILHAKHMIYMENQYFLSNLGWTEDELQMYEDASTQSELHHHSSTVVGQAATRGDPRWATQLFDVVEQAAAGGRQAPDLKHSHWNRLHSKLRKHSVGTQIRFVVNYCVKSSLEYLSQNLKIRRNDTGSMQRTCC